MKLLMKNGKKISQKEKQSFEEKAEIERKKYEEKMKKFENRVFDEPKKPKGPFNLIKSDLSKKNKKKIPLQINLKNNEEKDDNAALIYEDDFNVNMKFQKIRYSA